MKEKIKNFFMLSNEDIIMIMLALISFSFGVWTNYRQLWLQDIGYNITSISRILSASAVCSAVIIFIISFFSTKIKLKNIIIYSLIVRSVSLLFLFIFNVGFIIKTAMLLSIMSESIFSVALYPFISTVNKSHETYQKHVLINYVGKDFGVIFCGILLGVVVGNKIFSYTTCLFLALILTISSTIVLLLFEENKLSHKRNILPLKKALKNLFKKRDNNVYLFGQFLSETGYSIVFGMMMLLLTNNINFSVKFASVFIILCNLTGTIICSLINKYGKKLTPAISTIIKYGTRSITFAIAFLSNNITIYIIAIIIAYITTRILDDKVNGVFIRKIDTNSQFLFGNIRYFVLCVADGLGIFMSGILINYGISYIFLVSGFITLIAMFVYLQVHE